jgi:hypothetical protein
MVWSRVVRSGGQVQIGHTLLCLECTPDGLASRSHGMVTESDLAWAVTQGARGLFQLSASLVRLVTKLFGKLLGSWLTVGAILVLLYLSWPQFRHVAQRLFYQLYYRVLLLVG